jgi:hypothetical protein
MRTFSIAIMFLFAAAAAAQEPRPATSTGPTGFGSSILLPDFDPAKQTQKIIDSLGRLSSIQDAIRESKDRVGPLVASFQKNPSIDHREALERELAGLTLQLSRNVERVLGEKEKVRFALQDLNRLSVTAERSVESAGASLRSKATVEGESLEARRRELEDLARAVENADEAERPKALAAFKLVHRDFRRIQLRQQVLSATAQNHDNLLRGIRAVRRGFEAITGNLDDVFGRIEDAGALLSFVAGVRKESAELLGQYQRLFGSGSDSLRDALTTLASIEGQLQLVSTLTDSLDAAGSFATLVGEMETFSRTLLPEGGEAAAATTDDFWLNEVRKVSTGRFFEKQAPKPANSPGPRPTQPPAQTSAEPIGKANVRPTNNPANPK